MQLAGNFKLTMGNKKHLCETDLIGLDVLIETIIFIPETSIGCSNEKIITVQKLLSTDTSFIGTVHIVDI